MNLLLSVINKVLSIWYPSRVFLQPRGIYIETSKWCNLRCQQCSRTNLSKLSAEGNMCFDNFKKIIKQLPKLKRIKLYGLGEPFLNPEIFKMVEYLKNNYKKIYIDITTNGTLLNENTCRKIIDYKMDHINISLDAATKDTYEKIRGVDLFDRVIKNIDYLIKLKKKERSPLIVSTAFVIQKNNINELIQYIELTKKLDADYTTMQDLNLAWINENDKIVLNSKESLNEIEKAKKMAKENNIKLKYLKNPVPNKNKKRICPTPIIGDITITWDGYVTPCCMIADPNIINFGNIYQESFKKIFNNKKFIQFRKDLASDDKIPLFCKRCSLVRR